MSHLAVQRAAYAEIVTALADARPDPATERFDAELDAAVASGELDEQLARTLRWRQRESIRAIRDHLAEVLPTVLETLNSSTDTSAKTSADASVDTIASSDGDARTVNPASPRISHPERGAQPQRRVLVASLVAAPGSTTGPRVKGGEGRP